MSFFLTQAPAVRKLTQQRWEVELRSVQKHPPRSSVWTHLLAQMDIYDLFYLCLRSKLHFDAVMHFIEKRESSWASEDEGGVIRRNFHNC
jgi:hypothetical protein